MVPLASDALAVIFKLEPDVKLLPLLGLVIATTGNAGAATTVKLAALLVTAPAALVTTHSN